MTPVIARYCSVGAIANPAGLLLNSKTFASRRGNLRVGDCLGMRMFMEIMRSSLYLPI